jgi:hypothetical protein
VLVHRRDHEQGVAADVARGVRVHRRGLALPFTRETSALREKALAVWPRRRRQLDSDTLTFYSWSYIRLPPEAFA